MITTTKESDLGTMSDEDLFKLKDGYIKLHRHAKENLDEIHVELQRRLENNFKK